MAIQPHKWNEASVTSVRVLSLCLLVLLLGCSEGSDIVPVRGSVEFDGKPIAGATVTFVPAGNKGGISKGTTAADGTFELQLIGQNPLPGAKVGNHSVAISAVEVQAPGQGSGKEIGSLSMATSAPKVRSLLPEKYGSVTTSGLAFEVKAGEENVAAFALSK